MTKRAWLSDVSLDIQPVSATLDDMAVKKKKPSGVNVPNSQRSTVQILLRVPPEVAEDLDDLAERWNMTRSGAVGKLLEDRLEAEEDDT